MFFVESENGEAPSAQNALLRMRLFSDNARTLSQLSRSDQRVVQIAPERPFFAPFRGFSQRNPQLFPQILCKQWIAFPQDVRRSTGKVHDRRRFAVKTSRVQSRIHALLQRAWDVIN